MNSHWLYKLKKAADDGRIMLLQYISIEEQDADILTKALSKCKFEFHKDRIEVADNPFLIERAC